MLNNWYKIAESNDPEDGTIISDISAEERLTNHFDNIFDLIKKRTNGFKDDEERESVYLELVSTVDGLLRVKKSEDFKDKDKLEETLKNFRELANDKFKDFLMRDLEELKKQESEPEDLPESPEISDVPDLPPMGDLEGQEEPTQEEPLSQVASFKNRSILKTANVHDISEDTNVKGEVLQEYANLICKSLENCGIEFIAKINPDRNEVILYSEDGEQFLVASFNKKMFLNGITAMGKYSKIYPYNKLPFYQKFWKPVVEGLGHYFLEDMNILFSTNDISLPNITKDKQVFKLVGLDMASKKKKPFLLQFSGNPLMWVFKEDDGSREEVKTEYTIEDFIKNSPTKVKCIDSDLESVYNRIGEVVQIIPCDTHIELDVNFGRKIVRLTTSQIKKLDEI
jgi:hypothetical protein